jgi:hypothetical protein
MALGCGPPPKPPPPSITFTTVPNAEPGGAEKLAPIAGRVVGARPGERIVVFAKSDVGVWWVQPLASEPFTTIESDGTWTSKIHLGVEYAALLVQPAYRPPATADVLPRPGGDVVAIATVKGRGDFVPAPAKRLTFSGYEWTVRDKPSDRGGANAYASDNAWTDRDGALHLALRRRNNQWTSAEVAMSRALGYGTYAFVVRDTSQLDPTATLGMLTYDDSGVKQNHRELAIEISRWGDRSVSNAQYVVQPYYVPANVSRFAAPAGRTTHSFRWEPGRALFRTVRGTEVTADTRAEVEHEFTSGIPTPGNEHVLINLYFFRYSPSQVLGDVEVVIERFQYLP